MTIQMFYKCINQNYFLRLRVLTEEFINNLKYNKTNNNIFLFSRDSMEKVPMPCIVIVLKSNRRFNQYLNKLFDYKDKIKVFNSNKQNVKFLTDLRGFEKKLKLTVKFIILLKKIFSGLVR